MIKKIVATTKQLYNCEHFDKEGMVWHDGMRGRCDLSEDESNVSDELLESEDEGETMDDKREREAKQRCWKKKENLKKRVAATGGEGA